MWTNFPQMIENIVQRVQITRGRITKESPPRVSVIVVLTTAPSTIVARIVLTYDPKRSAPIPATSPTLSPTLSAITAGFLGSSSGIHASSLPTKSAPTSAALV